MFKRGMTILLGASLLSACGASDREVIQLDYIEDQWNIESYTKEGEIVQIDEKKEVLKACEGDRTTELKGDVTVYQSVFAGRNGVVSSIDPYSMKVVTYLEGDERYVVCREDYTNQLMAETIDAFPDFVDTTEGISVSRFPSLHQTSSSSKDQLMDPDELNIDEVDMMPFRDTLLEIEPALFGELELELGGKTTRHPLTSFEPTGIERPRQQFAIGLDRNTSQPYILFSFFNERFVVQPLQLAELEDPASMEQHAFEGLSVDTIVEPGQLKEGEAVPLYTFHYMRDGERVTETMTVRFVGGTLLKEGEEPESMLEEWMPDQEDGPRVVSHRKPFDGNDLVYPDFIEIPTGESEQVMEVLKEAEPVNRKGEPADYRYLTLTDGWKGQSFEVSVKQRSKKLDIYLTDPLRDQTFKLSSKGAEVFLDIFPEYKES
ncbi:hypothetical protein PJK55_03145 [Exiguobacterium sp. MMG028]|uniref:hypothetical protein n=1 Tax=Exiguobacterium sp. MMG028 TaxID=3021979 RepID=UPI0022FDF750|nr:hypothetical protein [Exiguobacterium sp. MMG028]MDA5559719.1 hypothetical protein [Exiguobacterium sp. MMG028]